LEPEVVVIETAEDKDELYKPEERSEISNGDVLASQNGLMFWGNYGGVVDALIAS
jgi:hypothetical protein